MYTDLDRRKFEEIDFQTGDVILFSAKRGLITRLIECWTESKYSHVGMVVRDPDFPHFSKKGVFLIESTNLDPLPDAEDHVRKYGVQMHDLYTVVETYPGRVYWRSLHCHRDEQFEKALVHAHEMVHNEKYDFNVGDWFEIAFKEKWFDLQRRDEFICSALVSFFHVSLGVLSKSTPWSVIRPADLGTEPKVKRIPLDRINGAILDPEIEILKAKD